MRRENNKFAKEWAANLIMIDSNDLGCLRRPLLGSTARSVVRHAPCSVEIVRPSRGASDSTRQGAIRQWNGELRTANLKGVIRQS